MIAYANDINDVRSAPKNSIGEISGAFMTAFDEKIKPIRKYNSCRQGAKVPRNLIHFDLR